jgi:hypothetical protein
MWAGDSFDAGFIHQFLRGAKLEDGLAFANVAGAYSTTKEGGTEAFRDRASLTNIVRQHWSAKESSFSAKRLILLCGRVIPTPAGLRRMP